MAAVDRVRSIPLFMLTPEISCILAITLSGCGCR